MAKRRKRGIKKGPVFLLILFVIGLFFILNYGIKTFNEKSTNDNNNSNNVTNPNDNNNKDEEKEKTYKLSLLATGDGLIHSVIYRSYYNNNTYDFSGALTEVKDIISKYDIAYYNQETPLGDNSLEYSGYPRFYTPKEYGDAMINIGFNMISLASNHAYDKGESGVIKTLDYFENTDALYHGMNRTEENTDNYIIKEKNNITYTMLSYTTLDNGLSSLLGNKQYMVNKYNKDKVKEDIEYLRDKVDVLIVAMHWGVEYTSSPTDEQKEIAKFLADLGVDIVIGNHPHVLQPITWIDDTLVMYSLGNFISNQYGTDDYNKLVGFLATLDITKTVKEDESKISIDNLGGELIFTYYKGDPINTAVHSGHKVIPFSKMTDGTYLKDYERLYTKYSNILTKMGAKLNIAPLPN